MATQVSVMNSEGFLIVNNLGQLMKQNYQKGYAQMNRGFRLYPSGFDFTKPFTLLIGVESNTTLGGGRNVYCDIRTSNNYYSYATGYPFGTFIIANNTLTLSNVAQALLDVRITNTGSLITAPHLTNISSSVLGLNAITHIDIGKGTTDAGYFRNSLGIFYVALFDRVISTGEYAYLVNNQNYNFPINYEGCKSFISTLSRAEILDFSAAQDGSDMRVGMRDVSGNNKHAEFDDLPAGTNASKLAFINTTSYFKLMI